MTRAGFLLSIVFLFVSAAALARGVSPYLPLNLDPEFERQVERVLMLGGRPALTRPIAAATVLDALPAACAADGILCENVRRALSRYMHSFDITHASVEIAAGDSSAKTIPNRYGLTSDNEVQASAWGYWQPSDYALLSFGGVANEDEAVATGSLLSVGFHRAQLDIGYRGHWLSPMTDSSMLISTQAPTMPSVTISNYAPLTRWGIHYEAFVARMSKSSAIVFDDGFTTGSPKLAGMHLSIEPALGWSLGVSRLMQYGGGERGGQSFSDLLKAFFSPSRYDNTNPNLDSNAQFGNQVAAITSQYMFPGRTPFTVYFEYAGEDTSRGRDYLLGNAALSAGIHFPRVWRTFDVTYEVSEWQNAWYVNQIYGDGLRNEGHVLGHWAGDERELGDAVGGQSHMLRLGWEPGFGGRAEMRVRMLDNESSSPVEYASAYDVTLSYSRPLLRLRVGAELFAGRDVFGESFNWAGAFVRYASEASGTARGLSSAGSAATADPSAEIFVEAGINASKVTIDLADDIPRESRRVDLTPHFAIGARRAVSDRSDLGARLEIDDVDGSLLVGVRAIDYRYRFSNPLALTFFVGAARYDLATPAYGIYYGIGGQWRDFIAGWDAGLDLKYATKVARDHLLPSDPVGGRNDSFYDISSTTLSFSRRF